MVAVIFLPKLYYINAAKTLWNLKHVDVDSLAERCVGGFRSDG